MPDHDAFLARAGWSGATREGIPGDASVRRYWRLRQPDGSRAVMMASGPVPTEPFCRIAAHLRRAGLSAPDLLHAEPPLLLLSDLGEMTVAQALSGGAEAEAPYAAATDVLIALHDTPPPEGLIRLDPRTAGDMVRIAARHYAPGAPEDALDAAMCAVMAQEVPGPMTLALRDFHAENLIWRPDRAGLARIGLLDFQDAFLAPAGYDLASLLRDVRQDVPPELARRMIARFCTGTGLDPRDLDGRLRCLAVQRNLRILGVFARLIRDEGKTRYRQFLPRVWRLLTEDLAHPAARPVAEIVAAHFRPPGQLDWAA